MPPLIPLVDYSDSDSDSDTSSSPDAKRAKPNSTSTASGLPPLPSRFHDLYAVAPRIGQQDDPSLHGGRKRSIPHVQGNWPTHVYIEWHLSRLEFDCLDEVFRTLAGVGEREEGLAVESHLKSDLGGELPLHLSLSRPNVLATAQRDGFMELLGDRVERLRVKPFAIDFTGWEWVSNFDQTRWFFVMKASKGPEKELSRLLELSNRTFEAFGQPPLYSQGADKLGGFHVSLAWSLKKPSDETMQKMEKAIMGEECCGKKIITLKGRPQRMTMDVETIRVKIGNVVHAVELNRKEKEEGSNSKKRRFSSSK
ncbi:hypothetical protein P167DRAFT_484854 [Morchella conica CCBAS932]|uniref:U6 snRNA phosphodiesterase n=1 Tax=Morchella conica CCBAS932 TaxID=1392247 RepID=A0A3N4L8R7_9PEZI|nr:hypothetical protein P167DRAFT_484854 [Morchella conica CCBAS932]